jgi:hypothetical protein
MFQYPEAAIPAWILSERSSPVACPRSNRSKSVQSVARYRTIGKVGERQSNRGCDNDEQRGNQANEPVDVEVDDASDARHLRLQEARSNQESAQREEDVHARFTATRVREVAMEAHDRDSSHRPQAIKRGPI